MAEALYQGKTRTLRDDKGNAILMLNGLRDSSILACNMPEGAYRMSAIPKTPETETAMIAVRDALGKATHPLRSLFNSSNAAISVNTPEAPLQRLCTEAAKAKGSAR